MKTVTLSIAIVLLSATYYFSEGNPCILNGEQLARLDADVREGVYGKVTGVVVLGQSGKPLYERYYGFASRSTVNPISSVTKSITSVLVGVCLDQGFIKSIDTPIYPYFPEYEHIFRSDSAKRRITLRHLLSQTAGLEWEEWKYPYNYVSNSLIALLETGRSWVATFFELPVEAEPGLRFSYNSLASQVVAEVLSRASGIPLEELARRFLLEPLRIGTYYWDRYSENGLPAWGGIALTTPDMAKLGLLVLNGGVCCGRQVVSAGWIEESVRISVHYTDSVGYGLHWWVRKPPESLIYAAGYGDQYVCIAPGKGVVVAVSSQNFSDYRWPREVEQLINAILDSIE